MVGKLESNAKLSSKLRLKLKLKLELSLATMKKYQQQAGAELCQTQFILNNNKKKLGLSWAKLSNWNWKFYLI